MVHRCGHVRSVRRAPTLAPPVPSQVLSLRMPKRCLMVSTVWASGWAPLYNPNGAHVITMRHGDMINQTFFLSLFPPKTRFLNERHFVAPLPPPQPP